jgi:hypothetical protein
MTLQHVIDTIQDANINFLIGSGMSMPYLKTVGNTEILLTELNDNVVLTKEKKEIIRSTILGNFFCDVILKNLEVINFDSTDSGMLEVLTNYKNFLDDLNIILIKRKSSLLKSQVNIFTTNIDVFLERALEESQLELNDGFTGHMKPTFALSNYRKSYKVRSLHYDNTAEMPTVNLLKLHGSLTWKATSKGIFYSDLDCINTIKAKWDIVEPKITSIKHCTSIPVFNAIIPSIDHDDSYPEFLSEYNTLAIINPTKEKFQTTVLNSNHYELLRTFSNELEKENTVLFVLGFSLADEHIRESILRAANSNPTLQIVIFAYNSTSAVEIKANIQSGGGNDKNRNILVLEPDTYGITEFTFENLNSKVFDTIREEVER